MTSSTGAGKKATAGLIEQIKDARETQKQHAKIDAAGLLDIIKRLYVELLSSLFVPQAAARWLVDLYFGIVARTLKNRPGLEFQSAIESMQSAVSSEALATYKKWVGAALGAVTIANAARRCLNFVGTILLIPLASWLYVQLAFPAIPQSLEGGRPIQVELLVSAEARRTARSFGIGGPAQKRSRLAKVRFGSPLFSCR